jgi:hypothetical protein
MSLVKTATKFEIRFGENCNTATVVGRVRHKHESFVMVCWDDDILRKVNFDDIELHGNCLLSAENRIKHMNGAKSPNFVGGSTKHVHHKPQNSFRAMTVDSDTESSSDAPLNRLEPEAPDNENSSSSTSNDLSNEEGTSSITSSENMTPQRPRET